MSTTVTGRVPKTECHRQVTVAALDGGGLAVAGERLLGVRRRSGELPPGRGAGLPSRGDGRACLVGAVAEGGYRAASLRSRVVQVTRAGSFFSSPPV